MKEENNMLKFYEKLSITIVVFLGVVVATAFIIGNFVKITNEKKAEENRIILD